MEDAPIVSVRGEALLEVDPELAQLTITVGAMDKERDRTLASLDKRADAFAKLLESFGEAIDRFETAAIHISPQFRDGKPRERIVGYSGTMRHTVFVKDFTKLGDLVVRLAEQEMTDVGGPWWSLRRDSDVYRQARMQAAHDAVRRAREYAEAVGSSVVGLLELADSGLLSEAARPEMDFGPRAGAAPMPAMLAARSAMEHEVSFQLEPGRQVVRANVEARFRLSPATLS